MIFGVVRVSGQSVETHRDTYLLSHLTVISVRRLRVCVTVNVVRVFAIRTSTPSYPGLIAIQ